MWEDFFHSQHTVTDIESHEVTHFLCLDFFTRFLANKTKGIKKLLIVKRARIRAWQEEEATGTAMADHLGRKNLTKEH
jgi:hypothetical protein